MKNSNVVDTSLRKINDMNTGTRKSMANFPHRILCAIDLTSVFTLVDLDFGVFFSGLLTVESKLMIFLFIQMSIV